MNSEKVKGIFPNSSVYSSIWRSTNCLHSVYKLKRLQMSHHYSYKASRKDNHILYHMYLWQMIYLFWEHFYNVGTCNLLNVEQTYMILCSEQQKNRLNVTDISISVRDTDTNMYLERSVCCIYLYHICSLNNIS